jgi:hypothetical protein
MSPKQVRQEVSTRKIYMETINQKYEYVRKNPLSAPPPQHDDVAAAMYSLVKVGK